MLPKNTLTDVILSAYLVFHHGLKNKLRL